MNVQRTEGIEVFEVLITEDVMGKLLLGWVILAFLKYCILLNLLTYITAI